MLQSQLFRWTSLSTCELTDLTELYYQFAVQLDLCSTSFTSKVVIIHYTIVFSVVRSHGTICGNFHRQSIPAQVQYPRYSPLWCHNHGKALVCWLYPGHLSPCSFGLVSAWLSFFLYGCAFECFVHEIVRLDGCTGMTGDSFFNDFCSTCGLWTAR